MKMSLANSNSNNAVITSCPQTTTTSTAATTSFATMSIAGSGINLFSFPQHLQSDAGQKAIMSRLESEIRLLESLRKFLQSQIKAGREYSTALGNASSTAMKNLTDPAHSPSESMTDGVVTKVCLHILEEFQSAAQTVKENSEFLQSTTIVQLSELIQEKKALLRGSKEEYEKIRGKLDQYKDSLGKSHEGYLKSYTCYEIARTKYEEQCAKGTGSGKGRRSDDTKEKFLRSKKRLQIAHADYLLLLQESTEYDRDLRTILLPGLLQIQQNWCEKGIKRWKEILDQIWSNSPGLTSIQGKLQNFEFQKEYLELIQKHKTMPLDPSGFKFEPPPACTNQPFAQSSIILDSTTLDALRSRHSDYEKRLKNSETSQKDRSDHVSKLKPSLVADLKGCELLMVKCETDRLRSLKNTLDALFKLKMNDITTATLPTTTTSSTLSHSPNFEETISLISEQSVKKGASRLATFFRNRVKKTVSFDESSSVINITNSGGSQLGLSENNKDSQPDNVSITTIDKNMNALLDEDWFHGVLPREDVVRLLRNDGDFLVRETMKNDERQIVLSVFWNGPKHFIVQTTPDGQFRFEGPIFPTVKELMDDYVRTKTPITSRSGAVIRKPIKRENWELNNDDVKLIEKIGRGNFGDVYKASLNGLLVAVKTCKVNLPEEQKKKFLQEGRILKQYSHPNIVSFVGICVQKQPIMIVMELVPGGSLLTHLKNKGVSLTRKQLGKMCLDAAAGMKYLEEKHCIHRDLAARNCLLDGGKNSVKISDFGMSREEQEYVVSDGLKQIPIKWTAPEALNYGKYTSLSDVWSYGILMFEIFSRGQTPYQGMSNTKAREMVESGYRLPAPERTPDVIYQLMTRCWQYDPEQRPRFSEIHSELEITLNSDLI